MPPTFRPTLDQVRTVMRAKNYRVFEGTNSESKGFDLNLFGVRTRGSVPDQFDDWVGVFYELKGLPTAYALFPATTDPGLHYLHNPLNAAGCAVMVPGQYRRLWRIGKHRGAYKALVQANPIKIYRDRDGNDRPDTDGEIREGIYGINLHRALSTRETQQIGKHSAGCQVLAVTQDFWYLMSLCDEGAKRWGNFFTYTLLDEADFDGVA